MSDTPDSSQPLENSGAAAIEAGERPAIAGNASDEVKEVLSSVHTYFMFPFTPGVFGDAIAKRVVTTEVAVRAHEDSEGKRYEGRVVVETTVEPDMVNGAWSLHGGCAAFLVDICSTMALSAILLTTEGTSPDNLESHFREVSQSMNIVYHSPAALGDKLRIVNTSLTRGSRVTSARTEVWNATHNRLVASGVHIKMKTLEPKLLSEMKSRL